MAQLDTATANKATAISQAYNVEVQAICSNADLTAEARTRGLARVYVAAKTEMVALKETWQRGNATSEADLIRAAFGTPSTSGADAIAARDADDRAALIQTAAEGRAVLARAETNKDAGLARSIALRAYNEVTSFYGDNEWGDVLNAFADARPGMADKLNELSEVRRSTVQGDLIGEAYFLVAVPPDLQSLTEYRIRAIAAGQ
jgi:hypothetical protein